MDKLEDEIEKHKKALEAELEKNQKQIDDEIQIICRKVRDAVADAKEEAIKSGQCCVIS